MKLSVRLTFLSTCGFGVLLGGCAVPPPLPIPLAKAAPKPINKKVTVTITSKVYTSTISSSYSVGPNSTPNVTVFWNGYGFISRADGRRLFQQSDDLAFKNGKTAQFTITKIVSINGPLSNSKTSSSQTTTVRRGVKATF